MIDVPYQNWYLGPVPNAGPEYAVLMIVPAPQQNPELSIPKIIILIHKVKMNIKLLIIMIDKMQTDISYFT